MIHKKIRLPSVLWPTYQSNWTQDKDKKLICLCLFFFIVSYPPRLKVLIQFFSWLLTLLYERDFFTWLSMHWFLVTATTTGQGNKCAIILHAHKVYKDMGHQSSESFSFSKATSNVDPWNILYIFWRPQTWWNIALPALNAGNAAGTIALQRLHDSNYWQGQNSNNLVQK